MRPFALILFLLASQRALAQPLDLVFVLDTTGSMSGEIREAKDRIHQLSRALQEARPGDRIRVGVVAYRDRGDAYLTRVHDLTSDVEQSYAFLAGLTADGGGDTPEDVLSALDVALRSIHWDRGEKTERQIFVVADAPPHLDYGDGPSTETLIAEALRRKIAVNAIGCRSLGPAGIDWFRAMAYATEGSYQHIGRVASDEGLAQAMLQTLAPPSPEVELSRLPRVALTPQGAGERTAGAGGLAVTPWMSGDGARRQCGLRLEVPNGFDLAALPELRQGNDALHVSVRLREGQGRVQRYVLERCPPAAAPIRIHLGA
jgi:Mg-chelatase subunit ChlD